MVHLSRLLFLSAVLAATQLVPQAHAQVENDASIGEVIVALPPEIVWSNGPPELPAGAQFALLEGNPAEAVPLTLRLKFPAKYRIPPHWHSVIEHVTVLSGTLYVGMGEKAEYSGGVALSASSFAAMPKKMVHYAWTGDEGVVFQLHSIGPWSITYVNPQDDPRQTGGK
jgi:hypothetical protein